MLSDIRQTFKEINTKRGSQSLPESNINEAYSSRQDLGIECEETLLFTHWKPGCEYTKNVVVRNIAKNTQKIYYKIPQTKYFSMDFPEAATLSSGMKLTLQVTFRPVAKEIYEDVVEFTTSNGKFQIPIIASLPQHEMDFPKEIDLGFCPVKETTRQYFDIENVGELCNYFEWKADTPFTITPSSGIVNAANRVQMMIEYLPNEAMATDIIAICSFGDKENWEKSKITKSMKITAVGKFSHLVAETKTLEFGNVYVGSSVEKRIILKNPSAVPCNFKIKRIDRESHSFFDISTTRGKLEPNGSFELKFKYNPMTVALHSKVYFDITTVSGNTTRISLSGCGIGPKVSIDQQLVNFNEILTGNTVIRSIVLRNDSDIVANYHFHSEKDTLFQIDKLSGTIKPRSSVVIQVKMQPTEPINYYRRVYCLVENQDTIFIDFIATCFDEKRRPATFNPIHLKNYQLRVLNGLVEFSPEQQEEMLKEGTLELIDGVLRYSDENVVNELGINREFTLASVTKKDKPYEGGRNTSEYFFSNLEENSACSILDTNIDFGSCPNGEKVLRVLNNSKGNMTSYWINNDQEGAAFTISPKIADIPAKSIAEFKVRFKPDVANVFYRSQFECYCYFKSMRTFRLVKDETFTPPWCLLADLSGNTISTKQGNLITKIRFHSSEVTFPPCNIGRSVYHTMSMVNDGDSAVKFVFIDQPYNANDTNFFNSVRPFSVKPREGVLRKGETQLIVLRFAPNSKKLYKDNLTCYFNDSVLSKCDIKLQGFGTYPEISFGTENEIYLKPTLVGQISTKIFHLQNKSSSSISFDWRIPEQFLKTITIAPAFGFLQGGNGIDVTCFFSPAVASNFSIKIPCFYYHDKDSAEKWNSTLLIHGIGIEGVLNVTPNSVKISDILLNTSMEKELTLYNPSECDIHYSLGIKKMIQRNDGKADLVEVENNLAESEFEVCQNSSCLPARSHESFKIKIRLKNELPQHFSVFYRISKQSLSYENELAILSNNNFSEYQHHLVSVEATACHPLICISDIRSPSLSITVLWQMFSLDKLNKLLGEAPTDPFAFAELYENDSLLNNEIDANSLPDDAGINFDFGARAIGTPPLKVRITLKNYGAVATNWALNFNDYSTSLESSVEQIARKLVMENGIFKVYPENGYLQPGESINIDMTYIHKLPGLNELPICFSLKNGPSRPGKNILINLMGYSIVEKETFLHLQSMHYDLLPVSIGTQHPPVQYYRLTNSSSVDIDYKIDHHALEKLNSDNMDFKIFQCVKGNGKIAAGGTEYLEFVFHPLEEKMYEFGLPITINNGTPEVILVRGQGVLEYPLGKEFKDPKILEGFTFYSPYTLSPLSDSILRLSKERLDFGNVPICVTMREIIVVTNNSVDSIAVSWNFPSVWPKNCVSIFPSEFLIHPGRSQLFKLSFIPDDTPRLYNFDVECVGVVQSKLNENKVTKDGNAAQSTESSPRRLKYEFDTLSRSNNEKVSPIREIVLARTKSIGKYTPLPAIPSEAKTVKDKDNLFKSSSGLRPPTKFVNYVGIRAQSHNTKEFETKYGHNGSFFRDTRTNNVIASSELRDPPLGHQLDFFMEIMSSILNDIFHDQAVQSIIEQPSRDGCCYYKTQSPVDNPETRTKQEILRFPVFANFAESAIEETIYNLMQEIESGEFDCTQYPKLVAKR